MRNDSHLVDVGQRARAAAFRRAAAGAAAVRERPGAAAHRVRVPRLELVGQVGNLEVKVNMSYLLFDEVII